MKLHVEKYEEAVAHWPKSGKVVLAQFDENNIVVYQAFSAPIAEWAVAHQRFGGPVYSFSRMSWIKPNFLWMMYRCGWLQKDELQARVLAITIARPLFDSIVRAAVPSSFDSTLYSSKEDWNLALKQSQVRLQWDPDHLPNGSKVERRAIQLGLRGEQLKAFSDPVCIEDISTFVSAQRGKPLSTLEVPKERVYPLDL